MKPEPTAEQVRATLARLAAERGESLAALSRMVHRSDRYLDTFVRLGVPARLPEDERRLLAIYLDVDERDLGARDPYVPSRLRRKRTGA